MASAAAAALLGWRLVTELRRPAPLPPSAVRLLIPPPAGAVFGAADEPLDAALSPDGRELVFVATANGSAQLWRAQLSDEKPERVAGTGNARWPAWIPGGRAVSFFAGDTLSRVDLATGAVAAVATLQGAAGATWLDDGTVLVGLDRGAVQRRQNGRSEPASRLQPGDASHRFPAAAGAGAWIYLAERSDGRRVIRLVRDGVERDVAAADGHGLVAAGWLVYPRAGALLAQRLGAGDGPEGRAVPLAAGVGVASSGRTFAALAPRVAVFAPQPGLQHRLQWFDRSGAALELASEPGDLWQVRLSADGRHAAVTMLEPLLRTLDVYVLRGGSGAPVPVTLGLAADTDPVWSPDGRRLLFRSVRNGQAQLFTREVGTAGAPEEPLPMPPANAALANLVPSDWSRTGGVLFSAVSGSRPGTDLFSVPADGGPPVVAAASGFNESGARLSPDGRWLAYVSDESGQPDVYVSRWPQGPRARVSQAGGTHPRWGGTSLYFLRGSEILRAERQPGDGPVFAVPTPVLARPGLRDFDVSARDGRLIVIAPAAGASAVTVRSIVDWPSALAVAGDR